MPETFIPRSELKPHLDRADVVWTRGGKLSLQGARIGHLSSGRMDGITVPHEKPRLNGELTMFESTEHLEPDVRSVFDRALSTVLNDRASAEASAEAVRRELADTSVKAELNRAFRELKKIALEVLEQISLVMARGSKIQKNHGQEGKD